MCDGLFGRSCEVKVTLLYKVDDWLDAGSLLAVFCTVIRPIK